VPSGCGSSVITYGLMPARSSNPILDSDVVEPFTKYSFVIRLSAIAVPSHPQPSMLTVLKLLSGIFYKANLERYRCKAYISKTACYFFSSKKPNKHMKDVTLTLLSLLMLLSCESGKKDSVDQAQEQNLNSAIDEKISKFLTEAADARMAGIEEGKLAREKGTTPLIRQYGEWMMSENNKMLKELRVLAASKNITLPASISEEHQDQFDDLKDEEGEDFNDEFLKAVRRDRKKELESFEDAEDFKDKDVKKFAATYRPVIASHLEKIEQLEAKAVNGQK
jgi:putative membrane protein